MWFDSDVRPAGRSQGCAASRLAAHSHRRQANTLHFTLSTTFHCLLSYTHTTIQYNSVTMPITFGSIGDMIAVGQLAKSLADALNESRGSSAEYRGPIRDLGLLGDVLAQVALLANVHETTLELAALYETVRRVIEPCRQSIEAFRQRLRKYEGPLGRDDANKVKSTMYKSLAVRRETRIGKAAHRIDCPNRPVEHALGRY